MRDDGLTSEQNGCKEAIKSVNAFLMEIKWIGLVKAYVLSIYLFGDMAD